MDESPEAARVTQARYEVARGEADPQVYEQALWRFAKEAREAVRLPDGRWAQPW